MEPDIKTAHKADESDVVIAAEVEAEVEAEFKEPAEEDDESDTDDEWFSKRPSADCRSTTLKWSHKNGVF